MLSKEQKLYCSHIYRSWKMVERICNRQELLEKGLALLWPEKEIPSHPKIQNPIGEAFSPLLSEAFWVLGHKEVPEKEEECLVNALFECLAEENVGKRWEAAASICAIFSRL